jgi:protein O-GlcNAc transferase
MPQPGEINPEKTGEIPGGTTGLEETALLNSSLGNLFLKKSECEKAAGYFKKAIEVYTNLEKLFPENKLNPDQLREKLLLLANKKAENKNNYLIACYTKGIIEMKQGLWEKAVNSFAGLLPERPMDDQVYHNIAICFKELGDGDLAIYYFNKVLAINTGDSESLRELGEVYTKLKKDDIKAIEYFEKYLPKQQNNAYIHNMLGYLYQKTGNNARAIDFFNKALQLAPSFQVALSNLLFFSLKIPGYSQEKIYNLTREYVSGFLKTLNIKPEEIYVHQKGNRDKKLKIGFLSGDFYDHVIMRFIGPVLENYNKNAFSVTCYAFAEKTDLLTDYCRSWVDSFKETNKLTFKELARQINDDKIDILVDLSGHTSRSKLFAMAYKPAPIQVSYLGYANTTGLETVDYFFTSKFLNNTDDERFFSEKLFFQDWAYRCLKNYHKLPDVGPLPAIKNGYITFGSFNNLSKLNDRVIATWSEILQKVPRSRLLICRKEASEKILLPQFEKHGITKDRVIFENKFSYEQYNRVDIHLDTFPYCGVTVVFDSLYMGVPVITLYGETFQGREAANINHTLGLGNLAAGDEKEYKATAVSLAGNTEELSKLKSSLRKRVLDSPFSDYRDFTRRIENAFIKMWQDYCRETC